MSAPSARITIGITAFLFAVILVMISRFEKLKRQQSLEATLPTLQAPDANVLNRYEAFGKIMAENGWFVKLMPAQALPSDPAVQQLRRGSFRASLPDEDGHHAIVGVDAFTYHPQASKPDLAEIASRFSKEWDSLHPLKHAKNDPDLTVRALAEAQSVFGMGRYSPKCYHLPHLIARCATNSYKPVL